MAVIDGRHAGLCVVDKEIPSRSYTGHLSVLYLFRGFADISSGGCSESGVGNMPYPCAGCGCECACDESEGGGVGCEDGGFTFADQGFRGEGQEKRSS